MAKKFEIEIRAKLKKNQVTKILKKLTDLHAKRLPKQHLTDYYLCPKKVRGFKGIEMHSVGTYSLRVRNKKSNTANSTSLNVKVITQKADHNSWREHEVLVSDSKEMLDILKAIGYKCFVKIDKVREPFSFGKFTVNLENIKNFGQVVEIEVMAIKNSEAIKESIRRLMDQLGITRDQIVPKSITNLIMKEKARF